MHRAALLPIILLTMPEGSQNSHFKIGHILSKLIAERHHLKCDKQIRLFVHTGLTLTEC